MIRPGLARDPDAVEEHFTEKNGFLTGRSAAIADWKHRKEEAQFGVLVNRLRVRKYQKDVRAEGGERLERLRARGRKYASKAEVVERQCDQAKTKRQARFRADAPVYTCQEASCGVQWCRVPVNGILPRGMAPRFCSETCANRHRYRSKTRTKQRHCSLCGKPGHNRRRCTEGAGP